MRRFSIYFLLGGALLTWASAAPRHPTNLEQTTSSSANEPGTVDLFHKHLENPENSTSSNVTLNDNGPSQGDNVTVEAITVDEDNAHSHDDDTHSSSSSEEEKDEEEEEEDEEEKSEKAKHKKRDNEETSDENPPKYDEGEIDQSGEIIENEEHETNATMKTPHPEKTLPEEADDEGKSRSKREFKDKDLCPVDEEEAKRKGQGK